MTAIQLVSLLSTDFSFTTLLNDHIAIFIVGLLILFLSIVLRAFRISIIELLLLSLFFVVLETFSNPLYLVLVVLQVMLGVWMIWKIKIAIDTTFYRQSEKTLKRPRDITSGGNPGTGHLLY